jgi:two-component system, cell cycle sensor histidine kinase and response regulator CckA
MRTAVAVGLFYCSEDELSAVRRHLPSSMIVTLYADDGSDAACDFAIIGSSAVKRRAVLTALREKLGGTPALLLLDEIDDDAPSIAGDFAVLAQSELYRLPYVLQRELRLHQAEAALRESERRYRELVENAHEGVWAFDHEGVTTYANHRMAALLGVSLESLQRASFFDFIDPEQRAIALTRLQGAANGAGEAHEFRFRRRDGTLFWASVSLSNAHDPGAEATAVLALVSDITPRRQMEEERRGREMQLAMAQHLGQIGSWEWDLENESAKLADRQVLVEPAERTRLIAQMHAAAADGSMFDAELHVTIDGTERIVHARGQVIGDGAPRRMTGMARDITTRKANEAALQESEARYRTILANIPEAVWSDDVMGRLAYISENIVDVWGYTAAEILGNGEFEFWSRHVHPADRERVLAAYEALFNDGVKYDVEYRFRRRDGEWIWIHNRAEIADVNGQRHAFGVISDVTERRRAAEELARSEARYRALFEQAGMIIFTIDAEGYFTSLNQTFEEITKWSVDDWIGRPFAELIAPDDREASIEHFNAMLRGERMTHDYRLRTKDGGEVIVESSPQAMRLDGEVIGVLGIARDVTRRRQEEVEHEKEKRLASLGQLAASVAHTFNNVLMSILPFAELLKRRAPEDPKVDVATKHIFQAIKRGRQVSQEIQRLARPVSSTSIVTIDVETWIADVAREARATLGSGCVVETTIKDRGLYARGDDSLLTHVTTNLLVNARDAMPNGGALTIEASRSENGQIEVSIADSGPGIPEPLLDRIFEPLFTTKRSGTGLGLSIAHQAMVQQEGALRVSSRLGEGSTFTIVLRPAPQPALEAAPQPQRRNTPRRIVLVEDDESVGEGICALLIDEGFDVRLVTTGGAALEAVAAFDPQLVLLDVNLPDMSGFQVYEDLAKRFPGLAVIFSTGHADARALGEAEHRNVPSIMKPYDIDELLAVVSRVRA